LGDSLDLLAQKLKLKTKRYKSVTCAYLWVLEMPTPLAWRRGRGLLNEDLLGLERIDSREKALNFREKEEKKR
jgi:hypothetical protein